MASTYRNGRDSRRQVRVVQRNLASGIYPVSELSYVVQAPAFQDPRVHERTSVAAACGNFHHPGRQSRNVGNGGLRESFISITELTV